MAHRRGRGGFGEREIIDLEDAYRREKVAELWQQVEALTHSIVALLNQHPAAEPTVVDYNPNDKNPFAGQSPARAQGDRLWCFSCSEHGHRQVNCPRPPRTSLFIDETQEFISEPLYDEAYPHDDIPNMESSSMIEHIVVFASFDSDAEGVCPSPTEDLLEILRSEKSKEVKLSLELEQNVSSVEKLLPSYQLLKNQDPTESHQKSTISENPVIDLQMTAVPHSLESLILYPVSESEVIYDFVIGDLLSDLHQLQKHQFWASYMNSKAASQDFNKYYPQEHALRSIWKNLIIWMRVRKRKISINSLSRLKHAADDSVHSNDDNAENSRANFVDPRENDANDAIINGEDDAIINGGN